MFTWKIQYTVDHIHRQNGGWRKIIPGLRSEADWLGASGGGWRLHDVATSRQRFPASRTKKFCHFWEKLCNFWGKCQFSKNVRNNNLLGSSYLK
jgi:hypothetical protein